jgi:hypothetical protein
MTIVYNPPTAPHISFPLFVHIVSNSTPLIFVVHNTLCISFVHFFTMPKPQQPELLDRHSGTGTRGLPTKGTSDIYCLLVTHHCAGGFKGWGRLGEEGATECPPVLDVNDPNYVDEEDDYAGKVLNRLQEKTDPHTLSHAHEGTSVYPSVGVAPKYASFSSVTICIVCLVK